MIVPREAETRFTMFRILQKALAIGACLVFLGTLMLPFYRFFPPGFVFPDIRSNPEELLWSYKLRSQYIVRGGGTAEYWFDSYWFRQTTTGFDGLRLVLPLMFVAQIATLAAALASIIRSKKVLALIPVVGCSIVLGLMAWTISTLSKNNTFAADTVQSGYWLIYPSLGLFLLALLMTLRPKHVADGKPADSQP